MNIPEHIEHDLLNLFEQSVGYKFRIKGTPLEDTVTGIDRKNKLVKGYRYGDFAVYLCELSGGVKNEPES